MKSLAVRDLFTQLMCVHQRVPVPVKNERLPDLRDKEFMVGEGAAILENGELVFRTYRNNLPMSWPFCPRIRRMTHGSAHSRLPLSLPMGSHRFKVRVGEVIDHHEVRNLVSSWYVAMGVRHGPYPDAPSGYDLDSMCRPRLHTSVTFVWLDVEVLRPDCLDHPEASSIWTLHSLARDEQEERTQTGFGPLGGAVAADILGRPFP